MKTVALSSVICADPHRVNDVNVIIKELKYSWLDSRLITQDKFKVRLINKEIKRTKMSNKVLMVKLILNDNVMNMSS